MKPFVVMTGMHRSGTSFLCRAFNLAGVYIGELDKLITHDWLPHKSNLRGHWEHQNILTLANETLFSNGGTWDNPPSQISLSKEIIEGVQATTKQLHENSLLGAGFKETRILLFLDKWAKYLPKPFVIVGIFRHPLAVAESLRIRSGFDYSKSLNLWFEYNSNLIAHIKSKGGYLINFDLPRNELFDELKGVFKSLNLCQEIDLEKWYSKDLIKSTKTVSHDYELPEKILNLYSQLLDRSINKRPEVQFTLSSKEKDEVIKRFLVELQNQGEYFKELLNKFNQTNSK